MFHQIVMFELGVLDDFVAKVTPSPTVLWSKYLLQIIDSQKVEYNTLTATQQTLLNLHYLSRLQKQLSPGLTLKQHLDTIFQPSLSSPLAPQLTADKCLAFWKSVVESVQQKSKEEQKRVESSGEYKSLLSLHG